MTGFIDVHCHILPGLDDGSQDMETTKQMLQYAWDEGITCIIATPHFQDGFAESDVRKIVAAYKLVAAEAKKIHPQFKILLGNELFNSVELPEKLDQKKAFTMALGHYVLVEFVTYIGYRDMGNALRSLQYHGYRPILAHVERYDCLLSEPDRIEELIDSGIYIQVNAMSVTGENGASTKRFVRKLLKKEQVHFIGTDAHSMRRRKPAMKKCMEIIEKKYGEEYAACLGRRNAISVIKDELI